MFDVESIDTTLDMKRILLLTWNQPSAGPRSGPTIGRLSYFFQDLARGLKPTVKKVTMLLLQRRREVVAIPLVIIERGTMIQNYVLEGIARVAGLVDVGFHEAPRPQHVGNMNPPHPVQPFPFD